MLILILLFVDSYWLFELQIHLLLGNLKAIIMTNSYWAFTMCQTLCFMCIILEGFSNLFMSMHLASGKLGFELRQSGTRVCFLVYFLLFCLPLKMFIIWGLHFLAVELQYLRAKRCLRIHHGFIICVRHNKNVQNLWPDRSIFRNLF